MTGKRDTTKPSCPEDFRHDEKLTATKLATGHSFH